MYWHDPIHMTFRIVRNKAAEKAKQAGQPPLSSQPSPGPTPSPLTAGPGGQTQIISPPASGGNVSYTYSINGILGLPNGQVALASPTAGHPMAAVQEGPGGKRKRMDDPGKLHMIHLLSSVYLSALWKRWTLLKMDIKDGHCSCYAGNRVMQLQVDEKYLKNIIINFISIKYIYWH